MAVSGCVIAGTSIAVDVWQANLTKNCSSFFLTHAHSDHTKGLNSKWRKKFYTSEITARIVIQKLGIKADLIIVLAVGESHILRLGFNSNEMMTVTVFDANHCPGSVMFLFQGSFGNILYTGDFRYDDGIPPYIECCRNVDIIYLDNTFAHNNFQFLSRRCERDAIMQVIQDSSDCNVMIGVRSLGKESLLVYIANCLQAQIVVSKEHLKLLQLLEMEDVFVTEWNASRIHAVPFWQITPRQVDQWNQVHRTVAIIPSGLPSVIRHPQIFAIPYSDHCSYAELHSFIKYIQPKEKVFPIIRNNLFGTSDMSMFNQYLNASESRRAENINFSLVPSDEAVRTPKKANKLIRTKRIYRRNTTRRNSLLAKRVPLKGVRFSDVNETP